MEQQGRMESCAEMTETLKELLIVLLTKCAPAQLMPPIMLYMSQKKPDYAVRVSLEVYDQLNFVNYITL